MSRVFSYFLRNESVVVFVLALVGIFFAAAGFKHGTLSFGWAFVSVLIGSAVCLYEFLLYEENKSKY